MVNHPCVQNDCSYYILLKEQLKKVMLDVIKDL